MKTLRDFVLDNPRFVVAHRGSSGTAPENTLAAIREAVSVGVKMVEIDVRITSDGQVVLLHDHVIGRTTSGSGTMKQLSYAELQNLDAGSWFGQKFSGEKIPLLREALELLRSNECYVNIEIKPPTEGENYQRRIEMIYQQVKQENMIPFTLFSSFHHASLKFLRGLDSSVHTAAINVPGDNRLPSVIAQDIGCEAFVCSLRECTHKRCDDARAHGLYVGVYTINTEEDVRKVIKYSVAAIVSNYPERIQGLMNAIAAGA